MIQEQEKIFYNLKDVLIIFLSYQTYIYFFYCCLLKVRRIENKIYVSFELEFLYLENFKLIRSIPFSSTIENLDKTNIPQILNRLQLNPLRRPFQNILSYSVHQNNLITKFKFQKQQFQKCFQQFLIKKQKKLINSEYPYNQRKSKIDDNKASNIAEGLKNCHQITSLVLNFKENYIGDFGTDTICIALADIKNLVNLKLDLSQNLIGDQGAFSIASSLSSCVSLTNLALIISKNKITDDGYSELGKCISNLQSLTSFECDLKHNEKLLTSKEILNCKNIKVLAISVELYESQIDHQREALKIKRLVKLKINYYTECFY
ncbi:hypothetical protein ABPG73_008475 [Tetrahymena malaccensis]